MLSIYNRVMILSPSLPWPWRGKIRCVRLTGSTRDSYVRLGTSDWYVLDEIFIEKEYAPFVNEQPDNVRTIVDLGSNIGMTVRLWQEQFPTARIVAAEPDEQNVEMIHRNIGPNATIIRACIGGSNRKVQLDRSGLSWTFRMTETGSGTEKQTVDAITVAKLLTEQNLTGSIDLLKCDIEGAEAEVFAKCAEWIPRVRYLVVELHALRKKPSRPTSSPTAVTSVSSDGPTKVET